MRIHSIGNSNEEDLWARLVGVVSKCLRFISIMKFEDNIYQIVYYSFILR